MHLRPHHLLCIQKFTGHGYSEDFTSHMTSIAAILKRVPDTAITVSHGCDEICRMCPNNSNGVCTSDEKVTLMDDAVLGTCDLTYDQNALWSQLADIARDRILNTEEFDNICAHCQWFELCGNREVLL